MEYLFCEAVVYWSSLYGRDAVMDLALTKNTLYITDGVIDEHLRFMFHYEVHSSSRKTQWCCCSSVLRKLALTHLNKNTNKH